MAEKREEKKGEKKEVKEMGTEMGEEDRLLMGGGDDEVGMTS